jgi:TPP-dependent indolepyruvate ferredoxin oxidoreductase alpha subunit
MNTDRMRRALERAENARTEQAYHQWLASLTPEHRAVHERPGPIICGTCVTRSTQQLAQSMQRLADRAARAGQSW